MMWPQEYIELKQIENLLVCGICYEFMDTSVMTLCSHNYCSLCIRKYLHYKTQCPACFAETFEKDLRKNKILDEIITHFSQIKDKLKRFLQIQMQFAKFNETDNASSDPKSLHQSKNVDANEQESKVIYKNIISDICISQNITSPSTHVQKDLSSPSTSGAIRIPLMFTPKSSKCPIATKTEETKIVTCPVCKVSISELKINRHLDDCLKRESANEKPQITESKRKPLSKLVFSLMKDVVLKKKAKEFGLSSQGDRKILEARLQRYIVLYNAECDKPNPRPVSELIKQCEDEENTERKANKISFLYKLQVTRNTEENVIENERKKYLETHKNSFESLIKQIKSKDSSKKPSARHSLFTENSESNEDIPHKCQTITENLNDSMIYTKETDIQLSNSDIYIPDSDSDTSCPLQMYSSSDPKKFLNVELSSANNNVLRNKSENDQTNNAQEASMFSNYSSIKTNEIEESDSSDAVSDTSIYDKATQSVLENSIYEDTLKNNSKNSPDSSKYKKLLKRKKKLSSKNEIKRMDVVTTSMKDLDSDGILNQEEEDERLKYTISLQDIVYDLSGNSDSKFDHGKLCSTSNEFLNTNEINSSNLEKENISSPECSSNRSLRKRTRDSTQTDNKSVSNRMKKIKKLSQYSTIENKELNSEKSLCILNDEKIECLTNKPQLRKRLSNVTENTNVLRKSARTKLKNNNSQNQFF